MNNLDEVLEKLGLESDGHYENKFYIIPIKDSNEYAKVYSLLGKNAIDTEYPAFDTNSNNNATKITNYFEIEHKNKNYLIFLIANFDEDKYYIKIGQDDR